jgi:di/tricarboxylate transporter
MTRPPTPNPLAGRSLRAPVLWGIVFGVIQAASPLGFWWLDPATVYALSLTLIAAVYIGFAVADGRPAVIAVEAAIAAVFVSPRWASPDRRGCWWPAWLAMGSRTCGSTGATMLPTLAGGRRSAWSSTGSSLRSLSC